jgi:type II secretion system protein D
MLRLPHPTCVAKWLLAICLLACGIAAVPVGRAMAQSEQRTAYPLAHAAADDAARVLRKVLSGLGEPSRVEVDQKRNQVLVWGSARVHETARDLLAALDREPEQPARSSVRTYPCRAADLEGIASALEDEFSAEGVRVAADGRTRRLVVLAPLHVHRRIAQRVAELEEELEPAAAEPSGRADASDDDALTRTIRLQTAPAEVEAILAEICGEALVRLGGPKNGIASFSFQISEDVEVLLHFNRRTQQATLVGPRPWVDDCARLLRMLDRPAGSRQQVTQLVRVDASRREDLRRVVDALLTVNQPDGKRTAAPAPDQDNGLRMVSRVFRLRRQPGQQPQEPLLARNRQPAANQPADGEEQAEDAPPDEPDMAGEQDEPDNDVDDDDGEQPAPADQPPAGQPQPAEEAGDMGLLGPVQIEYLEGLDAIVIRGSQRDVERVMQIIEDIERLSAETEPVIDLYELKHVGGEAMAAIVTQLYDQVLAGRQGRVSITPLIKPNALLLIGREDNVRSVMALIEKLDQPADPASQFQVFRLKHASAAAAQLVIREFLANRTGLGTRALVTVDFRSNSLIVQASPRDLLEVAELVNQLDTQTSESVNELRVFKLRHTLADEIAPLLQEALQPPEPAGGGGGFGFGRRGDGQGGGQQFQGPQDGAAAAAAFGQQFAGAAPGQQGLGAAGGGIQQQRAAQIRSMMLRFMSIDAQGQRVVSSGILSDVRITADRRANSLLVSAPAESMPLLEALIAHLDQPPSALAQIKVFPLERADAQTMVTLLESVFGTRAAQGQIAEQQLVTGGETSLLPLRFAVDRRTNSIIAAGSEEDLTVVEVLLLRLDESDVRQRQSAVYWLKNAPAINVSDAINEFLRTERQVQQADPGLLSPFEQIEREVVVVPEPVSNSLVVSATPRFFDEIARLVEDLDRRPPMVMIQVLIAEVTLNNTDELGIELGLQDSVLFDRSLLQNIQFRTVSTQQAVPGGGTITTQDQQVIAADIFPGFNFNNQPLGNSGSTQALQNGDKVGGQGLTSFSVGRVNGDLGFGGLVLSASSENVSVLLRALREGRRLDVLSRPQIMTLDNQPAFIQVGQRVPRITDTQTTQVGQTNSVVLENVGLILGVTPRISPDDLVVMEIDAEKSSLGPESEGIPISISATGGVIRSPRIDTTLAQTTISAADGQTVVLGGLITNSKSQTQRKVPWLGDVPLIGRLFRYDGMVRRKTELLIIMTPHVVRSQEDADRIRRLEAARMHWCLADVGRLHDVDDLRSRHDEWGDAETIVIYPDGQPNYEEVLPRTSQPSFQQPTPHGEQDTKRPHMMLPTPAEKSAPDRQILPELPPPDEPASPYDGNDDTSHAPSDGGSASTARSSLLLREPASRRQRGRGQTQPAPAEAAAFKDDTDLPSAASSVHSSRRRHVQPVAETSTQASGSERRQGVKRAFWQKQPEETSR